MLSTIYDDEMENVIVERKVVRKLSVCVKHKKFYMGGLDKITSFSSFTWKGLRKYYKIFPRLVELVLHNSSVNIYDKREGDVKMEEI